MLTLEDFHQQQRSIRQLVIGAIDEVSDRVDVIPPGWKNNLRWHAAHLWVTPWVLAVARMGDNMPFPHEYDSWFRHGSSPANWDANTPKWEQVRAELLPSLDRLFELLAHKDTGTPYPVPLNTSAGVTLHTLAQGIAYSGMHDGIHFGQVRALIRALG